MAKMSEFVALIVGIVVLNLTCQVDGSGLLQNVKYGTCFTAPNSNADNLDYSLTPCDITAPNQQFNVMAFVDYDTISGLVKSIFNNRCVAFYVPAGKVVQWLCYEVGDQHSHFQWRIVNGDFDNQFQLQVKINGQCLTPGNGGSSFLPEPCNTGSMNQFWRVLPTQEAINDVCKSPQLLLK